MSAPYNPNIDLDIERGAGLHLELNGRGVDDTYGAIGMAELAQLCEFPPVRVDVRYRRQQRQAAAAMACMIADELQRNEIWD
jgi:hypothetical protein